MKFDSQTFFVARGEKLLLNGQDEIDMKGGFSGANITVHTVGDTHFLQHSDAISVQWEKLDHVYMFMIMSKIYVKQKPDANFEGMCGNNNGNPNGNYHPPSLSLSPTQTQAHTDTHTHL